MPKGSRVGTFNKQTGQMNTEEESDMDDPKIAAKAPTVLELEPGTYHWCSCGRSRKQPFCDCSHKGTGFTPLELVIEEQKRVALCQCKLTSRPPFCDGTHKGL